MYTPTNRGESPLAARPSLDVGTPSPDPSIRAGMRSLLRWPRGRTALAAILAPPSVLGRRIAGGMALDRPLSIRRLLMRTMGVSLGLSLVWLAACCYEWGTGRRVLPWNPYGSCGASQPAALPETVRIGLYEEFPTPWRLARLKHVDFPVTLAVAAPSREVFLSLRASILHQYPQVREVYFWPLLTKHEGYYPGTWSDAAALQRVAADAEGLPVLWDLEMPPDLAHPSISSWPRNRVWLDQWLRARQQPVHIWRSHTSMGLDPLFLRLMGMHFDPLDYPQVSLHLDLYEIGAGWQHDQMARMLRCGVERYGSRFIPALGVLNDGAGPDNHFVTLPTLRRDLQLAREAGVGELWLFGVNGLNQAVVTTIRQTIPVEQE